jgi:mRNA-degrading endonuclease RelE of RelBE toxin-antitoxin system
MTFNLERASKYEKQLKYIIKNNFQNILNKVLQIEEILENGSWLLPNMKAEYKIEKLTNYNNFWKCKYIYNWRLIFAVDENIITLIDLDRRNTIYKLLIN